MARQTEVKVSLSAAEVRRFEELESQIARAAGDASRYQRDFVKFYNRTRSLEAAIKRHARKECDCRSPSECLTRLVTLTPANPRVPLGTKARGQGSRFKLK